MSRKIVKTNIKKEVKAMLRENNIDYISSAADHIKRSAENLIIKILKDASYYKEKSDGIKKSDILLALALNKENGLYMAPLKTMEIMDIADEYNCKQIQTKDMYGPKIPKECLVACNYQLENPNKKLKMHLEAAHKLENYRNRSLAAGNCFKYLVNYKNNNNMSYVVKNSNMRDIPFKFSIRPKFNLQHHNNSMLKRNNMHHN